MARFDATSAECLVFTYKDGLLAAVAHDLEIRVTKFVIDIDEQTHAVDARFDATSLRVVGAMRDDIESPDTLTAANKREIEANIVREVVHSEQYPEVRFVSSAVQESPKEYRIKGVLSLHGHRRQITIPVRRAGAAYVAEARIHQPDFGIRPYSALFGTLRVQPNVTVRVSVPAP